MLVFRIIKKTYEFIKACTLKFINRIMFYRVQKDYLKLEETINELLKTIEELQKNLNISPNEIASYNHSGST